LSGQASLGKKFYCSAFLKPMPNSSSFSRSLLTLMTFCLRLSVEFSFLIFVLLQLITVNKHQKSVFFNKNCKYLRPLLEVNRLAKFVRLCFIFYFSFTFFTMVYSIEQNTFIVVFYFRNGKFINGELSVCKNEFQQNIRTTFKIIVW
jgi:hypothetical protein